MLKDVLGIKVKIENMERKILTEKLGADELDLTLIPWAMDYNDAVNFMNVFTTGFQHPWCKRPIASCAMRSGVASYTSRLRRSCVGIVGPSSCGTRSSRRCGRVTSTAGVSSPTSSAMPSLARQEGRRRLPHLDRQSQIRVVEVPQHG